MFRAVLEVFVVLFITGTAERHLDTWRVQRTRKSGKNGNKPAKSVKPKGRLEISGPPAISSRTTVSQCGDTLAVQHHRSDFPVAKRKQSRARRKSNRIKSRGNTKCEDSNGNATRGESSSRVLIAKGAVT